MLIPTLICLCLADDPIPARVWDTVDVRRPTDVRLPPLHLGPGWKAGTVLKVDDLDDLKPLGAAVRAAIEPIAPQLRAEGVRGLGEYSFHKSTFPIDGITVRFFVFDDPAGCRDWWTRKYRGEGWQARYKAVPSDRFAIVDSTEMTRRAVAFGKVAIVAQHIGKGDDHLQVLDAVVAGLIKR